MFGMEQHTHVSCLNAAVIQGDTFLRNQLLSPCVCQRLDPWPQEAYSFGGDRDNENQRYRPAVLPWCESSRESEKGRIARGQGGWASLTQEAGLSFKGSGEGCWKGGEICETARPFNWKQTQTFCKLQSSWDPAVVWPGTVVLQVRSWDPRRCPPPFQEIHEVKAIF